MIEVKKTNAAIGSNRIYQAEVSLMVQVKQYKNRAIILWTVSRSSVLAESA